MKKKGWRGKRKKQGRDRGEKTRAGEYKTYPRRYVENVVATMAEKTDGWAGKKNGGLGEKKTGGSRGKKNGFRGRKKKNGGAVKKKRAMVGKKYIYRQGRVLVG